MEFHVPKISLGNIIAGLALCGGLVAVYRDIYAESKDNKTKILQIEKQIEEDKKSARVDRKEIREEVKEVKQDVKDMRKDVQQILHELARQGRERR